MAPPPSSDAVEYPAKANKSHRMSYTVVVMLNLLRLSDWVHLHTHELSARENSAGAKMQAGASHNETISAGQPRDT